MFKHHRYPKLIISSSCLIKLKFTLSYRDIEELMMIRGVKVDYSTIQRWVFKYAPMIEASMHKRKNRVCISWRMDETYIKVAGKDPYLYRAVDKFGDTVDFLLTKRRMKDSAQKFFNKATANNQNPRVINIDKIRRCKYLNNCVEQEHRNIKRRIAIDASFKEFESAQRTLTGIEVVSIIKKNKNR